MKMDEMSKAQKEFLKSFQTHKRIVTINRFLLFAVFTGLWETATRVGWIDGFIFSSPSGIFLCFKKMLLEENLLSHIGITLFETIVSFALVLVCSVLLAMLLWFHRKLSETLEPYLVILNSLPKSALAPLLIVWLGANYKTIILTGMSVAVFGSVLTLYTSFSAVEKEKVKLIYSLGGSKYQVMSKVILPSNIPVLFSLMKVNIGLCLVGVIIGEFIAARKGLGYLIIYGSQVFKLDWVIMSIFLLCILSMGFYSLLGWMEKKFNIQ